MVTAPSLGGQMRVLGLAFVAGGLALSFGLGIRGLLQAKLLALTVIPKLFRCNLPEKHRSIRSLDFRQRLSLDKGRFDVIMAKDGGWKAGIDSSNTQYLSRIRKKDDRPTSLSLRRCRCRPRRA